jgi:2-oxo-3-hexenedioate decarboxylase
MQERELNDIASELKKAVDAGTQLNPISSRFLDFNISDAYSVSQIIHKRRLEEGWVPVGRKIGFTNSKMWSEYGVREPVWAYMYDRTVTHVSDNTQAQCFIGQYCEPKIEPEIVLHFCSTPSVGASPLDLLACVDWIALGFEIVQSHFPGWKFQAADTIADRGLHAELFIGEHRAVNQLGQNIIQDLERFEVALSCNSTLCELGYGLNVLGSPLIAIGHLISVLSKQHNAMPIQAGEIITTGTLTSAFSVSAGQIWSASVNGILLPALDIRFEI